jgi:hypothetical protein
MKAMMKQVVAVNRVGIINTPNQPMYRRLFVLVIHWQNRSHTDVASVRCNVVVMVQIIAMYLVRMNLGKQSLPCF